MTRVSVIIPVCNDAERLRMCLDRLAEQTLPRGEFEVVVVDNGSSEPPRALVESYPFARFAEESRQGSYAARNRGLELAQGGTLAFTDADCLPACDWLEKGRQGLEAGAPNGLLGGRVQLFAEDEKRPTSVELYEFATGFHQDYFVNEARFSVTANLFTTRECLDAVGPFNAEQKSGGDLEWGNRVDAAGRPLVYDPAVLVKHPARKSLKAITTKARRHTGGRFVLNQKRRGRFFSLHALRTLWRSVCPNVRAMLKARRRLRDQGYGFAAWLRVCGVILVVQYAKLFEFFRLVVRGKPENR